MALTEDRIEYRVVVDGDFLHDDSCGFDGQAEAYRYADHMRNYDHAAEVLSRHVTTTYTDWK